MGKIEFLAYYILNVNGIEGGGGGGGSPTLFMIKFTVSTRSTKPLDLLGCISVNLFVLVRRFT